MKPAFLRYASIASPLGRLYISATEKGLCRLVLDGSEMIFIQGLQDHYGIAPVHAGEYFDEMEKELTLYFHGELKKLDLPIDWSDISPFQKRVLGELLKVPYGETTSYGEIARRIGKPQASRAVGTAIARNPLPIIIPCHRMIPSDGSLGGYLWGPEIKKKLLQLEGVNLKHRTEPKKQ